MRLIAGLAIALIVAGFSAYAYETWLYRSPKVQLDTRRIAAANAWVRKVEPPAPGVLRVSDKPAFRKVKPVPFNPDKGAGTISQAGCSGYPPGNPPYTSSAAAELAILALCQWDGHYFNDSFESLDCFETGDQEYDCVLALTDNVYSIHVDSFGDIY